MDSFAAVFKQKGLEWKIEVDDKILIYGDPDRLARVLRICFGMQFHTAIQIL